MRKNILIIDDELALARLTKLWVESAGHRGTIANSGPAGLEAVLVERPDVILLDIMMPGMTGFEVSRRLKSDAELSHVPVIFLSAKVHDSARREALAAGGKYFLSKPYEGTDLLATIKSALDAETSVESVKEGAESCS